MSLFGDDPLSGADQPTPTPGPHEPTKVDESWGSLLFGKRRGKGHARPSQQSRGDGEREQKRPGSEKAKPLFSGIIDSRNTSLAIYPDGTFTLRGGLRDESTPDRLMRIEHDADSMRRKSVTGRGSAALATGGLSLLANNNRGVGYLTVVGEASGVQTFTTRNPMGFILENHRKAKAAGDAVLAPHPAATTEAPVPGAFNIATQLQQLAELHGAGALSDDEFAAAKARLLEQ
jgi:hypothetical protein